MGGSVAVAIRKRNGVVICQDRWTNSTTHWFKSIKMREGDEAFVDEYLSCDGLIVKKAPLAPLGYGLIVLDYMTNHFLSMQGYASYEYISDIEAFGDFKGAEFVELFREHAEKGLLTLEMLTDSSHVIEKLRPEIAIARAQSLYERTYKMHLRPYIRYRIDMAPMTYIEYEETKRGCGSLKLKMQKLGFVFDAAAERAWKEFYEYY